VTATLSGTVADIAQRMADLAALRLVCMCTGRTACVRDPSHMLRLYARFFLNALTTE